MDDDPYAALAAVYDWLVPDALLQPEGAAAAYDDVVTGLPPGARILDCAAGTGLLAVGLALRGFEVTATDASAAMLARAQQAAASRAVQLRTAVCRWQDLDTLSLEPVDAVFCVGNSLTHAAGAAERRAALAAMRRALRGEGVVAVTSRNWELLRARGPGLQIPDSLVVRDGRAGFVVFNWHLPERWQDPHWLDVAVALLEDELRLTTQVQQLRFWPFTSTELLEDMRAVGLRPRSSTYAPDVERYLVTATPQLRPSSGFGQERARTPSL